MAASAASAVGNLNSVGAVLFDMDGVCTFHTAGRQRRQLLCLRGSHAQCDMQACPTLALVQKALSRLTP